MRRLLAVRNYFGSPDNFIIAAILISGFGLRGIGLNIGLPDTPDPREVIIAQDVLNLIHFTAPPQTYNWPGTAWFYSVAAVGKLLSICGLHLTEARVILLARCINTLLSTATLWFTYAIGLTYFPGRCGFKPHLPRENGLMHFSGRCGLKVRPLPREIGHNSASIGLTSFPGRCGLKVRPLPREIGHNSASIGLTSFSGRCGLKVRPLSREIGHNSASIGLTSFPGRCGLEPHLSREIGHNSASIGLTSFSGRCGLEPHLSREIGHNSAILRPSCSIGKHMDNRRVGQIAAGLLAVSMLHATNESRFALVDIPATFCVTLFLWCVVRAHLSSAALTFPTAVWLGVIAGVGCAVKFTTIFVCFSLLIFIRSKHFYRRLALSIGISALTFTLLCPYWLIDLLSPTWNLFFEDFWYETTHYHRGHFGLISTAEAGVLKRFVYLWTLLKWGMGLPLALLAAFGVLYAMISLKSKTGRAPILEGLLLAFVIPYLLFIGIHKVKFTRHLLILYPALTVLAAIALARVPSTIGSLFKFVYGSSPQGSKRHDIFGKWVYGGVAGVVVFYSFVYTAAFAAVMLTQPTRIAVSEWITAHIPPEESIASAPVILFDWLLPDLDLEPGR